MVTIAERIVERMSALGLKQVNIVNATTAGKGAVSKWIAGVNTPNGENLTALSRLLGVSPEWLLTGRELHTQMIRVDSWDHLTPVDDDEVEIPFYKNFLVACGHGSNGEALESETRRLRLSKSTLRGKGIEKNNAVAMTAMGDSMSPTISDQATVFVDLGRNTIKDGRIFAIERGGLFQFKYLYALPMGGVRIVSENAVEYPEERLTAQEIQEQGFKVHGWAFSWQTLVNW